MSSRQIGLRLRMIGAIIGLGVVMVGLLAGVWTVFYFILRFFEVEFTIYVSFSAAAVTLLVIGYLEYRHLDTIERFADAHPVDREAAPELYQTTTRVATQLDIPIPTIAVSERETPEALAVGFRPSNIHLMLSIGTIEALDDDELETVIAHELAHVKNRDAMIMTAVSLPVVLADGLRSRTAQVDEPGILGIIIVPLSLLSDIVWVVGRTIMARLSRARERAADRAAAEITGSPAVLGSALQKLDQNIADTPNQDLREVSAISSLSILPLEPQELEKVMLGPQGETEPSHWWLQKRLHRLERWLFDTHPSTDDRIESLISR